MYYVLGTIGTILLLILSLAFTKPNNFNYERSGVINAPPEVIFPYLRDFKKGSEWSPFEKVDPNMKKTYSGPEAGVGAVMEFEGNSEAGSGRLEIKSEIPNREVQVELHMTKPFEALNMISYRLTPQIGSTLFTWSMSGKNNFLGKLIMVFIDCEKMVGDQFSSGIQNLKTIIEGGGATMSINLTTNPEIITRPPSLFWYIQKLGPFMKQAPMAWQEFWKLAGPKINKANMIGMMALSKVDDTKNGDDAFVYQAGVSLKNTPTKMVEGLDVRIIPEGKFARFLLTGSYTQLAQAYPQAIKIVGEQKLRIRKDFFIESYLNSPENTAEDKLQTEILVPIE